MVYMIIRPYPNIKKVLMPHHKKILFIGRKGIWIPKLVKIMYDPITLHIPAEKRKDLIAREWKEEIRKKMAVPDNVNTMCEILDFLLEKDVNIHIYEIQNALYVNPSFLDELKNEMMKDRDGVTVVSCSSISLAKKLLNYLRWNFDFVDHIEEFDFRTAYKIMKEMGYDDIEDSVLMWSVFGGILKYYELLDESGLSVIEFIKKMFFKPPYPMLSEVKLMLKEELRKEFKTYFSILQAISEGHRTFGKIASYIGFKDTSVSKYLLALREDHELIHRKKDVFEKGVNRYYISSNLIDFWFRFVWKNSSQYELGNVDFPEEEFNKYVDLKYKQIIEDYADLFVNFEIKKVGRLWAKNEEDECIVALGSKEQAIFYVRWTNPDEDEFQRYIEYARDMSNRIKTRKKQHIIIVVKGYDWQIIPNEYNLEDLEEKLQE